MVFNSIQDFSIYITEYSLENNTSLINSILNFCEENDLEPDQISRLISPSLKEALEQEFIELNFLKKDTVTSDLFEGV